MDLSCPQCCSVIVEKIKDATGTLFDLKHIVMYNNRVFQVHVVEVMGWDVCGGAGELPLTGSEEIDALPAA